MKASNCNENKADICFISMATANFFCATGQNENITFLEEDSQENSPKLISKTDHVMWCLFVTVSQITYSTRANNYIFRQFPNKPSIPSRRATITKGLISNPKYNKKYMLWVKSNNVTYMQLFVGKPGFLRFGQIMVMYFLLLHNTHSIMYY